VPALPRDVGRSGRLHRALPEAAAARLPQGDLQVHGAEQQGAPAPPGPVPRADRGHLHDRHAVVPVLLVDEYDPDEGLALETIQETYEFVHERWQQGTDEVIRYDGDVPESTPERIAHGREMFMDPKQANCVQCHGEHGRGTYDSPRPPSAWERDPETGELVVVKDDWGNAIEVRNLSRGAFRFGRRPIDLFRRIYAGINGTPMPAHFGMQITEPDGDQRPLGEDDIWDLVHYVRSLSAHEPSAAEEEPHR
jgi:mono/diheme cytochrome c family protein